MAKVLFVHNGSSGRFAFLAAALMARGHQCALINSPDGSDIAGVPTKKWTPIKLNSTNIFQPAQRAERDFSRGKAAAETARAWEAEGFTPDLIIGHPGWGEMIFLREVFPDAKQIQIAEYFYISRGGDIDFDPEFGLPQFDDRVRVHALNAGLALSYAEADWIVAPTPFQGSVIPRGLRHHVRVIHEGVDTALARPMPDAQIKFQNGATVKAGDPVVTFINRRFEPMRGFHVFMRMLPAFLKMHPTAHVILVGMDDRDIYGLRPKDGRTWKQILLAEVGPHLDNSRVHFVGTLNYVNLIRLLSLSAAHVYYTYPFVLSWSLLDAMATECLIVGSDTAPVRDVIVHGENGLLVDFFDTDALARTLTDACNDPARFVPLRKAARATAIKDYDRATVCEPDWLKLVDEALGGV